MRVVENTPDRLVLRYFSWRVWAALAAAVVIVNLAPLPSTDRTDTSELIDGTFAIVVAMIMAIAILFQWIRYTELRLERGTNTLHIRQLYFFIWKQRRFSLDDLAEADVTRSSVPFFWPIIPFNLTLVLDRGESTGRHQVNHYDLIGNDTASANAINAWLSMDIDSTKTQA